MAPAMQPCVFRTIVRWRRPASARPSSGIRTARSPSWLAALAVLASCACGKRSDPAAQVTEHAPTAAESAKAAKLREPVSRRPGCQLDVRGHQRVSWRTYWSPPKLGEPHPTHARSTYWASEEERQLAAKRNIDVPLEFTCAGTPDNGLGGAFSAVSRTSATQDVRFGAGAYALVNGADMHRIEPGEFAVGVLLIGEQLYEPLGGTLDILGFDRRGVRGSFTLEGKLESSTGKGERVHVRGAFDIPCGDVAQSACQR